LPLLVAPAGSTQLRLTPYLYITKGKTDRLLLSSALIACVQTALIVISGVLAVVVMAFVLVVRSHRAWLAKQTPAGVWRAEVPDGHVLLEFEGGPSEGTYKQITVKAGATAKEFGHWHHASGQLQLLIMATDEAGHPGFGVSTLHTVRYVAPEEIGIEGPHRPALVYKRAPEGVRVEMEPAGA